MKEISSFLVAAAVGLPPQRSAGSSTAGRTGSVPGERYERSPDERASIFSIGFTLTMAPGFGVLKELRGLGTYAERRLSFGCSIRRGRCTSLGGGGYIKFRAEKAVCKITFSDILTFGNPKFK